LGAKEAVEPLLSKLANTSGPEHDAYLSGLADIGDSRAESVLQAAIENGNADKSARLLAGLGRIATPSSIRRLKMICLNGKKDLRQAALEGLILAGDLALTAIKGPALRLEIAARLHSAQADQAIAQALSDPSLTAKAIDAAKGREALVESIWPTAMLPNDPTISRRMTVLASTIRGRDILKKLSTQPTFIGLAKRALALATELSEMHQN
jgi:hypothetical protein